MKKIFLTKQFLKFTLIGGFNTLSGSAYAYVFSFYLQDNLAFICGYILALCIAYFLNSFFVFKEALSFARALKFLISYIPNFIIQNIIVIIIYNLLGWHKLIAYGAAAAVGVSVTYLIMKFFTFHKKGQKD